MKFLLPLFLLFLTACSGSSDDRAPRETIEHKRFVGEVVINALNKTKSCDWVNSQRELKSPYLAFLWQEGNTDLECVLQFLELPQAKLVNVYLDNGTGERNGVVASPTIESNSRRARSVLNLFSNHCVNCVVILTPQLEDNFVAEEACAFAENLRLVSGEFSENVFINRNPVKGDQVLKSAHCYDAFELHEDTASAELPATGLCIYSNDGHDLDIGDTLWELPSVIDVQSLKQRAREFQNCIVGVWTADGNCLKGDASNAPPLLERECNTDERTRLEMRELLNELSV
jgi:hypothetical protein